MKLSSGGGFAKDKFFFDNVPNRQISSQYEMQYQGSLNHVIIIIQFIIFYVNPKITNFTLKCTVFIFNGNITDLQMLELKETHISIYTDRNLVSKIVALDY